VKRLLQRINIVSRSGFSHDKHILLSLGKMPSSIDLCMRVQVGNPALIGLDRKLIALVDIARRGRFSLAHK
jgi:hypothetical protein